MTPETVNPTFARGLGRLMFAARWLMAPFYLGLLLGLLLLIAKFAQKLIAMGPSLWTMSISDTVVAILGLVDLSLVGNLVLIVVLAGWQGFVGPLLETGPGDQPSWLALDFSAVKLKVIGSLATIAAVDMLESFMHIGTVAVASVTWQLAILMSFGLLAVLLAMMDRLSHGPKE
jgi:uncharacterized protein (TIGR00645 family)